MCYLSGTSSDTTRGCHCMYASSALVLSEDRHLGGLVVAAGETNFPRFSAWFGANSSSGKQRRLLGELHTRLAASGNFNSDR